jgi:DNA-binding NarL/FixJ family response regulator
MSTKIVLAEGQRLVHDGLRKILEAQPGISVVAEAHDSLTAIEMCVQHQPDIAILELVLPGLPGPSAISRIRNEAKGTRCIALSSQESRGYVQQALRAGASGYVVKSAPATELIEAINAVKMGRFYVSPAVAGHLVEAASFTGERTTAGLDMLTAREREVLQLIAEGLTSKEIATRLGVSTKTANTHRASLMEKLDIHKAPSLVRFAIREGLVAP